MDPKTVEALKAAAEGVAPGGINFIPGLPSLAPLAVNAGQAIANGGGAGMPVPSPMPAGMEPAKAEGPQPPGVIDTLRAMTPGGAAAWGAATLLGGPAGLVVGSPPYVNAVAEASKPVPPSSSAPPGTNFWAPSPPAPVTQSGGAAGGSFSFPAMPGYTSANQSAAVKGIQDAATALGAAEGARSTATAQQIDENARLITAQRDHQMQERAKMQSEVDRVVDDYRNAKIDPNRLWSNASAAGQVSSMLGIILGGIGSGLQGGPNQALGVVERLIDRDIAAQTADIGKKANLVGMMQQKYGNLVDAQQAAKIYLGEITKANLDKIAATFDDPVQRARAELFSRQAGLELGKTKDDLSNRVSDRNFQMAYTAAMMQGSAGGGQQAYRYGTRNLNGLQTKLGPEGVMEARGKAASQTFDLPDGTRALASSPKAAEDSKTIVRSYVGFQENMARLKSGVLGAAEMARATDAARAELSILLGNGQSSESTKKEADNIVGGLFARVMPGMDPYSVAVGIANDRLAAAVKAATGDTYEIPGAGKVGGTTVRPVGGK